MNNPDGTLLQRVEELDPARQVPLAEPDQVDQTLRWVLAQPRQSSTSRPRSLQHAAAWVATAVMAVGVGIWATWPSSDDSAFASWVPIPTELEEAVVAASADQCGGEITLTTATGEVRPAFEVEPVLAEKRGDLAFILLEGEHTYMECVVVGGTDGEDWDVMVSAVHGDVGDGDPVSVPTPEGPADITVLSAGDVAWPHGGAADDVISSAYGMAGPDVEAIQVTTSDGIQAQATVDDGWWAVWFPNASSINKHVTVTTTGGDTYTANLWGLFAHTH